ncbi:hypothetical protein BpHYR1_048891 [Brachionus plicatilis]|uniref:Uncharacterized protein n=1 Tax=Brachionus plicatilis TaxID=10195 RepID=A0A3M7SRZ4_BRAPC|nr:hypothetical protein BpHYR1_048891 [Brachionus plicatilis]
MDYILYSLFDDNQQENLKKTYIIFRKNYQIHLIKSILFLPIILNLKHFSGTIHIETYHKLVERLLNLTNASKKLVLKLRLKEKEVVEVQEKRKLRMRNQVAHLRVFYQYCLVKNWFKEHNFPWCPRPPDLNPILNLWAYIDTNFLIIG